MNQVNSLFNPVVHDMSGLAWCGLCALSCITGLSTATVKNTIRTNLIWKHKIAGLYRSEILTSLHDLGFSSHKVENASGLVQNWCIPNHTQVQLIFVRGHVMTRKADIIIDSHAKYGQLAKLHNYRAYRIESVYDILPIADKQIIKIGNHAFDVNEM